MNFTVPKVVLIVAIIYTAIILFQNCSVSSELPPNSAEQGAPNPNLTDAPSASPTIQNLQPTQIPETSFKQIVEVGTGKTYAEPINVPWSILKPSTLVKIYYRNSPYANKWVITTEATETEPLVIRGIPGPNGELPIITGNGAHTRYIKEYPEEFITFPNDERSVVKVGNYQTNNAKYVTIENLEIRSAHPSYSFYDDTGTFRAAYSDNAASIHIESGDFITIKNCILHDSGNGLFSSGTNILVDGNYIYGNGINGSIYQHNSYTESITITFQFNHYGPLRDGAGGNNLKDRSAGTLIRYNWIESGSRNLDLVHSIKPTLITDNQALYRKTFVYGNILVKDNKQSNNGVIHYGGDDSAEIASYRKGTLWFFNNTVVSLRTGNTTIFGPSTAEETVQAFNNIFYATAGASSLALLGSVGTLILKNNWIMQGYKNTFQNPFTGIIESSAQSAPTGTDPKFVSINSGQPSNSDFSLQDGSPAIKAASDLPTNFPIEHSIGFQYVPHQGKKIRNFSAPYDQGAFGK